MNVLGSFVFYLPVLWQLWNFWTKMFVYMRVLSAKKEINFERDVQFQTLTHLYIFRPHQHLFWLQNVFKSWIDARKCSLEVIQTSEIL